MQRAELVLVKLNQKSSDNSAFKFQRIYRNLFNPDFYLHAYSKIYHSEGNMTPGTDGTTIDGFNKNWITELIRLLKAEKYYPTPVRRTYIPKKNKSLRPLGIPSFKEKLIQEIIREILEAIYEPLFSENSHGFRQHRSCHTALYQIKRNCNGSSWVIEGDIQSYFDTIDHDILIEILKQKIDDGRFIELIRRLLKAGYTKEGITYDTISGAPQGGIASPILANIYLNEFDKYMEMVISKYSKGKERKANPEYKRLRNNAYYRRKVGKIEEAKELGKQFRKLPSKAPIDPQFIRINYVRYADDFTIFMIGPRTLAERVRTEISQFLKEKLRLKLNMEKTLITNLLTGKAKFLGYEILKAKCDSKVITDSIGRKKRCVNGIIQLRIPHKVISERIKPFTRNGKPIHRRDRLYLPIVELIKKYNEEIRGLYNYYCMANNVGNLLHKFKYYHYFSLVNTVCRKEQTSTVGILKKYGIPVPRKVGTGTKKIIGIKYMTRQGEKRLLYYDRPLKRIENPIYPKPMPHDQNKFIPSTCELLQRLNRGKCELCNSQVGSESLIVHHIRKLKDIDSLVEERKIPKWITLMKKMRRKTLMVCALCHEVIHKKI